MTYRGHHVPAVRAAPDTTTADDWRDQAACRGHDPELWFSDTWRTSGPHGAETDRDYAVAAAIRICGTCPVARECLEEDATYPPASRFGIRGGMTAYTRERRRQKALRRAREAS